MMNREEQGKRMAQLIAKCWADEDFKQKLLADPVVTLKDEGIELPDGLSVKVVENTDKVFHLVVPPQPSDSELSEDDLDDVAGGQGDFCVNCNCARPRSEPFRRSQLPSWIKTRDQDWD